MSVIAITGGIAAGKSAACAQFTKLGVPVIDTDAISHQLTRANGDAIPFIRETFGSDYIDEANALNREKMRKLIFSDAHAKTKLEGIIHPLIHQAVALQVAQNETDRQQIANPLVAYQLIAVPLLFETKHYAELADASVVIDCEPEIQISRAMQRSQLSRETVESIINAQIAREERLALADYVIENNGDINALNVKIDALHQTLNAFCRKMQRRD